jgi:O-antigen ligase
VTGSAKSDIRTARSEGRGSSYWALWLGLFVVALALLGGSSRPDPIQNAALRPLAALLLIPALYRLRIADAAGAKAILAFGGLMLGWMILQLIPMPPAMWQALPGRAQIAELDKLAGMQGIWRPISLAPFRGLNALFGMIIPLTALLLAMSERLKAHSLLIAIAGLGIGNAALGILQVAGGPSSPFYLFTITNRGAPAGIFANENHSAVFASIVMLVIARLAVEGRSQRLPAWLRLSLAPAYLFVLVATLLSGSRAGLFAAMLAICAGGLMIGVEWLSGGSAPPAADPANLRKRRFALSLLAAGTAGVTVLIAAFLLLDRVPAAQDLSASKAFADLRWSLWPVLVTMMSEHWVLGTGFGSFDVAYRLYEPTALLLPFYINQAHNDWAQLVIEGGLPTVVIVLGLIGWLLAALVRLARRRPKPVAFLVFWAAWLAITAAASAVDYPLRTPIFQAVSVWLLLCLSRDFTELDSRVRDQQ